jgi:hypothetical protein
MPNQPEVCRRFNELPWHDSELRCISANYSIGSDNRGGHYEVFLRVNLQARNNVESKEQFLPVEIRFFQSRIFHADLDLLGVKYCGGDISGAKCSEESEYMRRTDETRIASFDLNQDENTLVGLRHFHIYLCPPSGEIDIIARDFEIVEI